MAVTPPDELLRRDRTLLVLVDLQERLIPELVDAPAVLGRAGLLLEAGRVLGVPVLATEQNPRVFGRTAPPLQPYLPAGGPIEKMTFSCLGAPAFEDAVRNARRPQLVVFGAESHICVAQTVLGALAAGYRVHVPADAVTARSSLDRKVGLDRMRAAGAVITSTEMAVYELLERAGTDEFRALLPAIKAAAAGA